MRLYLYRLPSITAGLIHTAAGAFALDDPLEAAVTAPRPAPPDDFMHGTLPIVLTWLSLLLILCLIVFLVAARRHLRKIAPPDITSLDWIRLGRFAWRQIRRAVVLLVGGTVLLIGLLLLVLPGPAFLVIPLGLAILSTEFAWPRRVFARGREYAVRLRDRWQRWRGQRRSADPPS